MTGSAGRVSQSRAAQGTVQLLAGQLVFLLVGYPVTILLARGLGPEHYGIYGVILSILFWVEEASRFGIPSATAKLVAEDHERAPQVERTAFVLSLILLLAIGGFFWLAAPVLARIFHVPDGTVWFRIAALDIPIYGVFCYYHGVSRGRREFGVLSTAVAVYALAKLIGVLCLFALEPSIVGALLVNILGSVAGLLFFAARLHISPLPWHHDLIAPLCRLALPLAIGILGESLFYNLDLWSLKLLAQERAPETIGIYVASGQLAKPLPRLAMFAVSFVLLPSLSRALATKDIALAQHYIQGAVRFLWVLLLPLSVLVAIEAQNLMELSYSTPYITGAPVLGVLIFGFSLFAFLITFLTIVKARGEIYFSAEIVFGLLLLLLLLNLALIPQYGTIGAASALTLTTGVGTLATGVLVYRRFGSFITSSTLVKGILATALMTTIDLQVSVTNFLLLPKCAVLLVCYTLFLILLRELRREDLQPFVFWRKRLTTEKLCSESESCQTLLTCSCRCHHKAEWPRWWQSGKSPHTSRHRPRPRA